MHPFITGMKNKVAFHLVALMFDLTPHTVSIYRSSVTKELAYLSYSFELPARLAICAITPATVGHRFVGYIP